MFKFKTLAQDMTQAQEERSKRIAEIRREEAERKKQAKIKIKERSAEVKSLLEGFRRDQAKTAAAWQELVTTMQSKRGIAKASLQRRQSKNKQYQENAAD